MNSLDSGLAHGTNGSPQLTIENYEMSKKAMENALFPSNPTVDYYSGGKSNQILPSKYCNWLGVNQRESLLRRAKDARLRNAIDQLYRPGAIIGDGSTASVIKFEKRTGLHLGRSGGTHEQKGREMLIYLERNILSRNLSKGDKKLAKRLAYKLKQALGGK